MNKTICAFAIGAILFTPFFSHAAEVDIYGRANISVDYLDDGDDYNVGTITSNASRLGFKVDHTLENGMTAFAQIEQEINFSAGTSDGKANTFATRDTFAGLRSDDYGQLRIGRFDSPFKMARSPVNLFGDMSGDIRNLTRAERLKFDERNDNTVEYKSPKFGGGFNVLGSISVHDGVVLDKNENGDEVSDTKAYDLALNYKKERIDFAAAYENFESNASNAKSLSRDSYRIAGSYKMTDAFTLGGLYQFSQEDNDTVPDAQIFGVAGEYKFTPKTLVRGEYFYRDVDTDEKNSTMIALGLEHKLDPQFRLYTNLAVILNEDKANLAPWNEGRANNNAKTVVMAATGENATALSAGFRYDF